MTEDNRPYSTTARGVALVAIGLVFGALVFEGARRYQVRPEILNYLDCSDVVEVQQEHTTRVDCAHSETLRSCGAVKKGDRVDLKESGCVLFSGEMNAGLRLLHNIPLDLNRATAEDLALLDGLGPKMALRIVEYREQHGAFATIEDLAGVRGIGEMSVVKWRPYLTIGDLLP